MRWLLGFSKNYLFVVVIMFEIEKVFDRVSELKYPTVNALSGLRTAFKCEIYVTFGRAIEMQMLEENTIEQVVIYCASLKLAGVGGTKWTEKVARKRVEKIIAESREPVAT